MIMEVIEADGYYLPPEFREQVKTFRTEVYQDGDATVRLKIPSVTGAMVEVLADHLKEEREKYLSHQPIERIVDVLDQASRKWLDRSYPYRELVLKTIPVITGFSREVVQASIDAEMESSLREDIWRALRSAWTTFNTLPNWMGTAGPSVPSSSSPSSPKTSQGCHTCCS
jgi:hypothetical protein